METGTDHPQNQSPMKTASTTDDTEASRDESTEGKDRENEPREALTGVLESQAEQGSSYEEVTGPGEEHEPFQAESKNISESGVVEPDSTTEQEVLPLCNTSPVTAQTEWKDKHEQEIVHVTKPELYQLWEEESYQTRDEESHRPHEQDSHQIQEQESCQTQGQDQKEESHILKVEELDLSLEHQEQQSQQTVEQESCQPKEQASHQPQEQDSQSQRREPYQLQKQEVHQPHEQDLHQTKKETAHPTQELKQHKFQKDESKELQESNKHQEQESHRHQAQETCHPQSQDTALLEDLSLESDASLLQRQGTSDREAPETKEDEKRRKIFVIGKTGTGKSSLCNKIRGADVFRTGRSFKQVTTEVKEDTVTLCGQNITVVDTPDINDENENRRKEIVNSWKKLSEGFTYMVVLAVRCDQRYSPAEYAVYRQIRDLWGRDDLSKRLVVAFTFADTREGPSVDMSEELKEVWPELKDVMEEAGGRYVLFSNDPGNTDEQPVHELIEFTTKLEQGPPRVWEPLGGCFVLILAVPIVFAIVILAHSYVHCSHDPSSYLCPRRNN